MCLSLSGRAQRNSFLLILRAFEEAKSEEPYEFGFLFNQLYFYFVFLLSLFLQINLIAFRFYSAFADFGLGESALKMTKKA